MLNIKNYVAGKKFMLELELFHRKNLPEFKVIQIGDNPASNTYINGKMKDAKEVGFTLTVDKYPENITQKRLLNIIDKLNNDNSIHGFIVQMPLPKHINEEKIKSAISPKKDLDGFNPLSYYKPCTPLGIINFLEHNNYSFSGKNAVIIGRSNIVGKPMAKMLLDKDCNTTILHSKTKLEDLKRYIEHADLIVVAVGKPDFLDDTFNYKPSAFIIDVGINKSESSIVGDCMKNLNVKYQSPVPGGVGLLTRLTLLENMLESLSYR